MTLGLIEQSHIEFQDPWKSFTNRTEITSLFFKFQVYFWPL